MTSKKKVIINIVCEHDIVEVIAQPIKIKGSEWKLYIHDSHTLTYRYAISEFTTGMAVAHGQNKEEVIYHATNKFSDHKDKLEEILEAGKRELTDYGYTFPVNKTDS